MIVKPEDVRELGLKRNVLPQVREHYDDGFKVSDIPTHIAIMFREPGQRHLNHDLTDMASVDMYHDFDTETRYYQCTGCGCYNSPKGEVVTDRCVKINKAQIVDSEDRYGRKRWQETNEVITPLCNECMMELHG
jgi:hypothetical protein